MVLVGFWVGIGVSVAGEGVSLGCISEARVVDVGSRVIDGVWVCSLPAPARIFPNPRFLSKKNPPRMMIARKIMPPARINQSHPRGFFCG
jgi:hypothetical protein